MLVINAHIIRPVAGRFVICDTARRFRTLEAAATFAMRHPYTARG